MKKQSSKKKIMGAIAVLTMVLGIGFWSMRAAVPLHAAGKVSQNEKTSQKKSEPERLIESIALDAQTGEDGIVVRPNAVTLGITDTNQAPTMPTTASTLYTVVTQPASGGTLSFAYSVNGNKVTGSNIKPKPLDDGIVGFAGKYTVRIWSNKGAHTTFEDPLIEIEVPVSITCENSINTNTIDVLTNKSGAVILAASRNTVLYPQQLVDGVGDDPQRLASLIRQEMPVFKAWNAETGEAIDQDKLEVDATTVSDTYQKDQIGVPKVTLKVDGTSLSTTRDVVLFGATLKAPGFAFFQGASIGATASNFFNQIQLVTPIKNATPAKDIDVEWVKDLAGNPIAGNRPDTSTVGFQWGYLKMTEKEGDRLSTVIPIPITVRSKGVLEGNTVAGGATQLLADKNKVNRVALFNSLPLIPAAKLEGLNEETIKELLHIEAKNMANGDLLAVTVSKLTITPETRGLLLIPVTTELEGQSYSATISAVIVPDAVFGETAVDDWEMLPYIGTEPTSGQGMLYNTVTDSIVGFPFRGNSKGYGGMGFDAGNENSLGAGFGLGVRLQEDDGSSSKGPAFTQPHAFPIAFIPAINNETLYQARPIDWAALRGIPSPDSKSTWQKAMTSQWYLRKKNADELKQLLLDNENQVLYTYDISKARNLNFLVWTEMYNLSPTERQFAMLQLAEMSLWNGSAEYTSSLDLQSLGNQGGFAGKFKVPKLGTGGGFTEFELSMNLKDKKGNWLSDFTMWNLEKVNKGVGEYLNNTQNVFAKGSTPTTTDVQKRNNFNQPGLEVEDIAKGKTIIKESTIGLAIAAPWKMIPQDQALTGAVEYYYGKALPYMQFQAEPDEINVYPNDSRQNFDLTYELGLIPQDDDYGPIEITLPNGEIVNHYFGEHYNVPLHKDEATETYQTDPQSLSVPRDTMPEDWNPTPGTIKSYDVTFQAEIETDGAKYQGLVAEELDVPINVYHIGAQPLGQVVKRSDNPWEVTAQDLVDQATVVILPGHEDQARYAFIDNDGNPPAINKVGFQLVKVKMWDAADPDQWTIIEVPLQVIDGNLPEKGLYIGAQTPIELKQSQVADESDYRLEKLVLQESQAVAWDVATGSTADIQLKVADLGGLDGTAQAGDEFTVTLQAEKEELTPATKEITVKIVSGMTAEGVKQTVTLGTLATHWTSLTPAELQALVIDVESGGQEVTDYEVNFPIDQITGEPILPDTSRVTDKGKFIVELSDQSGTKTEIEVPLVVTWGNAIAIGDQTIADARQGKSVYALALQEDSEGQPYLVGTYGDLPNDEALTKPLGDSAKPTESYFELGLLERPTAAGKEHAVEISDGPEMSGRFTQLLNGQTMTTYLADDSAITINEKKAVNYGEIIGVYVADDLQKALYTDGKMSQPLERLPQDHTVFGVITKEGFVPLYLDHLIVQRRPVSISTTLADQGLVGYEANFASIASYFTIPVAPNESGEDILADKFKWIAPDGVASIPDPRLTFGDETAEPPVPSHPMGSGGVYVAEPLVDEAGQRPTDLATTAWVKYKYEVTYLLTAADLSITVKDQEDLAFKNGTLSSATQILPRKKQDWAINVQSPSPDWYVTAGMQDHFITEDRQHELKGAQIFLKPQADGETGLKYLPIFAETTGNDSGVVVASYQENALGEINWGANEDSGFLLRILPGDGELIAGKNEADAPLYRTTVQFILTNGPLGNDGE